MAANPYWEQLDHELQRAKGLGIEVSFKCTQTGDDESWVCLEGPFPHFSARQPSDAYRYLSAFCDGVIHERFSGQHATPAD